MRKVANKIFLAASGIHFTRSRINMPCSYVMQLKGICKLIRDARIAFNGALQPRSNQIVIIGNINYNYPGLASCRN
jgi:hypothetical protein